MIRGYFEMDALIGDLLKTVTVGGELVGRGFGVPEAEVVEDRRFPYVSFHLLDDDPMEANRMQDLTYAFWNSATSVFEVWPMPDPVRLTYQFDLYSKSQRDMIELTRETFSRFPRRRGFLVDPTGQDVAVELQGLQDFTKDIDVQGDSRERMFKRCLTYCFDAQLQTAAEPLTTVGRVESVRHELYDMAKQGDATAPPDDVATVPEE